jgi:hypothetical protein
VRRLLLPRRLGPLELLELLELLEQPAQLELLELPELPERLQLRAWPVGQQVRDAVPPHLVAVVAAEQQVVRNRGMVVFASRWQPWRQLRLQR